MISSQTVIQEIKCYSSASLIRVKVGKIGKQIPRIRFNYDEGSQSCEPE